MNTRQQQILEAIIREYVDTTQPVSSGILNKKYNFNASPATIRAEMKKLEETGYLCQPHTSAGRIPTEKGYRFFIGQPSEDMFEKCFNELFKQAGRRETMIRMEEFTLIVTNYRTSKKKPETIGLIGPTKMRYDYNISLINKLREMLESYE